MVAVVPRLIHLNGPSRVGKSTLARRYADEHPGTLTLDLDLLAGLIGGWKEDFSAALKVARGHGRELATRHLRSGYDVILPQLVTIYDHDPDPAFEIAAGTADATYIQVALMVDDQEHLQRLHGKRPTTEVEARIQTALENPESDLVQKIRRHLNDYLAKRPHTIRLDTTGLGEDASYEGLLKVLDGPRWTG
jgi:AAA domain-containing protein